MALATTIQLAVLLAATLLLALLGLVGVGLCRRLLRPSLDQPAQRRERDGVDPWLESARRLDQSQP
ncbi:MAG: hypothetical protein D6824_05075 [Planctomycetota bacterium]|nr:MAG: hypothetical protein D6824_05075 [Planctomycetota bacterium]